jgi:XTP/dITP diphosphohydrolase
VRRLLLATNNPGKVREFRRLLEGSGFDVVTPAEAGISLDVAETGTTYEENAALKAEAYAATGGCIALADDSGIEVDALDGRPGVYSARFGTTDLDDAGRTALLLQELSTTPLAQRGARYRAVVAIARPNGPVALFSGVQEGSIAFAGRGEGGFGYDPVFLIDGVRTQSEITAVEKDQISHRGRAVRAALAWLREEYL